MVEFNEPNEHTENRNWIKLEDIRILQAEETTEELYKFRTD